MRTIEHTKPWALLTAVVNLLLGATAVLLADFGMLSWFFFLTQVWFWTLGLPTMLAVLAVTGLWGIPGWTTLPLWAHTAFASVLAFAFQIGGFLILNRGLRRAAKKKA